MAKKSKEIQKISERKDFQKVSEEQDKLKENDTTAGGSFKNTDILIPFLFILAYTLFTHFYDLGSRAFHHDEGIHAYYSWEIATKGPGCYKYDPTYHGTFLYFANAVIYRIWGGVLHAVATDVNARVVPALCGLILIFLFFALKRFIDPKTAVFITLLGAISPTLTYFSRFIRHDIYITVTTLGMIICFLYYWREKNSDYLSFCFALCALSFVTKEDTYIILFIFLSFIFFKCMVEKATNTVLQEQDIISYLGKSFSEVVIKKKGYRLALSILFLRIITVNNLYYYIQNKKTGDINPADSLNTFIQNIRGFFVINDEAINKLREVDLENLKNFNEKLNFLDQLKNKVFSQSALTVELAKLSFHEEEIKMILHHTYVNRDFMALLNGLFSFAVIFSVFFTSFFTNPKGLFTGIFGFFTYWVFNQQVKPRIPGPFYYYISKLCLYEFATVLFALIGIWYLLRKKDRLTPVIFYSSLILIYLYSFAQDTVPLLSQKFVLYPACIAGFFYVLWGILRMIFYLEGKGTFVSFVIYWFLSSLFIYSYAQEKVPWLMVPIVLPMTVMAGMTLGKIFQEGKSYFKYTTAVILVILLWFNVYTSFRLNFKMGDNPVEPMVFTQTTRDVVDTTERLSDIVNKLNKEEKERGQKKNYVIFVDNEVSWPFVWYLRDFTVQYSLPSSAEDAQRGIAILSSPEKQNSVEPFLSGNFSREHMKLRAWWIADNRKLLSYLWKKDLFKIDDKTLDMLKNNISEEKLNLIKPFKSHVFTGDEFADTLKNMHFSPDEIQLISKRSVRNGFEEFFNIIYRFVFFRHVWNDTGSTDYILYMKKDFSKLPPLEAVPLMGLKVAHERTPSLPSTLVDKVLVAGSRGTSGGQFNCPRDIDIDSDGNIYAVDSLNHRIEKFSSCGVFLSSWGEQGSKEGKFQEPCGIGVDKKNGYVYVADTWNHRIERFSLDGVYQFSWKGEFYGPRDVAVDSQGDIYVTDTGNCFIKKYNQKGELLKQFGSKGSGDGQLQEPVGLTVDNEENIVVADTWNQRVQRFKPDGTFLDKFDVPGWYGNNIREPYLTIDSSDKLYLTDSSQEKILIYELKGAKLVSVLTTKSAMGKMSAPVGIAWNEKDKKLIISDFNGNSLQIIDLKQ